MTGSSCGFLSPKSRTTASMLASSSSSTTSLTPSSSKSMPGPSFRPTIAAADVEEGFHQLLEERVRHGGLGRKGIGGIGPEVCDASREQAVGDGLGIHVGKAIDVEVVDQCFLEGLHQLRDSPLVSLDCEDGLDPVADATRQLGQCRSERFRGLDHLVGAQAEGGAPFLTPPIDVRFISGPERASLPTRWRRRRGGARYRGCSSRVL